MLKKNNKKHTFLNSDWGRITFSPQTQISNPIKGHLQGTYTVSRGDSHVIIFFIYWYLSRAIRNVLIIQNLHYETI